MELADHLDLWHVTVSHFSEKARWALDYKGVEYRSHALMPGLHMAIVLWLTRGRSYTVPAVGIGGRRIGDSTAIVAALEERHPEPPLYPRPGAERRRALEIEEWFDVELAPYVRRFVFHGLLRDPEIFAEVGELAMPRAFQAMGEPGRRCLRPLIGLRYDARDDAAAGSARERILAGFDRLEAELGTDDHLVGDTFTVADLTAASLLYPIVRPPEAYVTVERMPAGVETAARRTARAPRLSLGRGDVPPPSPPAGIPTPTRIGVESKCLRSVSGRRTDALHCRRSEGPKRRVLQATWQRERGNHVFGANPHLVGAQLFQRQPDS